MLAVRTPEPARQVMTLDRLWILVAILVPVFRVWVIPMGTVDLAYHVRIGEAILHGAGIPRTDTLSFTAAGRPWTDQQWAGQVALALIHRAGGWTTVAVAWAVLAGAAVALLIVFAGMLPRIRVEERALARAFGADYEDYANSTARVLPHVW